MRHRTNEGRQATGRSAVVTMHSFVVTHVGNYGNSPSSTLRVELFVQDEEAHAWDTEIARAFVLQNTPEVLGQDSSVAEKSCGH